MIRVGSQLHRGGGEEKISFPLSTCCSYQIDKLATPENLTKQQFSFGNLEAVCRKVLSVFRL